MGRIAGVTAEETRRKLLDAAAAEFDRRGYDGTRVADIAAGADVSNGALYRHFASKSELLSAALADRGSRELRSLLPGADGRSIADLLTAIGRALDRVPAKRGGLMVEALVASRRDGEVRQASSRHLADAEAWLAGLIRDGQEEGTIDPVLEPSALARFCVMVVLGATLLSPADMPDVPASGWADMIERIARAVAAPRG